MRVLTDMVDAEFGVFDFLFVKTDIWAIVFSLSLSQLNEEKVNSKKSFLFQHMMRLELS
jgi:hypothetical protein